MWTTKKPDKPGWYWVKTKRSGTTQIMLVCGPPDGLLVEGLHDGNGYGGMFIDLYCSIERLWAGPITEPKRRHEPLDDAFDAFTVCPDCGEKGCITVGFPYRAGIEDPGVDRACGKCGFYWNIIE